MIFAVVTEYTESRRTSCCVIFVFGKGEIGISDEKLSIQTMAHTREIRHGGNRILRYHISYLVIIGHENITAFYESLAKTLLEFAEATAQACVSTFDELSRRERMQFRERVIRATPTVVFEDARYLSIRYDFSSSIHGNGRRSVRLAHTFDLNTDCLADAASFLPKRTRKRIPSKDFYLTKEGRPVFVVNDGIGRGENAVREIRLGED